MWTSPGASSINHQLEETNYFLTSEDYLKEMIERRRQIEPLAEARKGEARQAIGADLLAYYGLVDWNQASIKAEITMGYSALDCRELKKINFAIHPNQHSGPPAFCRTCHHYSIWLYLNFLTMHNNFRINKVAWIKSKYKKFWTGWFRNIENTSWHTCFKSMFHSLKHIFLIEQINNEYYTSI